METPVADALNALYVICVPRREDSTDRKTKLELYRRMLIAYPQDLVLESIANYRGAYFPALDELRKPIEQDRRYIDRRQRASALRKFLVDGPDPAEKEITPEERARVAAGFDKLMAELGAGPPPRAAHEQTPKGRGKLARKKTTRQRARKSQQGATP